MAPRTDRAGTEDPTSRIIGWRSMTSMIRSIEAAPCWNMLMTHPTEIMGQLSWARYALN